MSYPLLATVRRRMVSLAHAPPRPSLALLLRRRRWRFSMPPHPVFGLDLGWVREVVVAMLTPPLRHIFFVLCHLTAGRRSPHSLLLLPLCGLLRSIPHERIQVVMRAFSRPSSASTSSGTHCVMTVTTTTTTRYFYQYKTYFSK